MLTSLQAYQQAEGVPLQVRKQLAQATLLASAPTLAHLVDQLAVRVTLEWQSRQPVVLIENPTGLVLAGMLLQRLAFPLQVATFTRQDKQIEVQAKSGLDWRAVLVVAGKVTSELNGLVSAYPGIAEVTDVGSIGLLPDAACTDSVLHPAHFEIDTTALAEMNLVGCGFALAGYGANLPELYSC